MRKVIAFGVGFSGKRIIEQDVQKGDEYEFVNNMLSALNYLYARLVQIDGFSIFEEYQMFSDIYRRINKVVEMLFCSKGVADFMTPEMFSQKIDLIIKINKRVENFNKIVTQFSRNITENFHVKKIGNFKLSALKPFKPIDFDELYKKSKHLNIPLNLMMGINKKAR